MIIVIHMTDWGKLCPAHKSYVTYAEEQILEIQDYYDRHSDYYSEAELISKEIDSIAKYVCIVESSGADASLMWEARRKCIREWLKDKTAMTRHFYGSKRPLREIFYKEVSEVVWSL